MSKNNIAEKLVDLQTEVARYVESNSNVDWSAPDLITGILGSPCKPSPQWQRQRAVLTMARLIGSLASMDLSDFGIENGLVRILECGECRVVSNVFERIFISKLQRIQSMNNDEAAQYLLAGHSPETLARLRPEFAAATVDEMLERIRPKKINLNVHLV